MRILSLWILLAHDLIRKPGTTLGPSPRAGVFGITRGRIRTLQTCRSQGAAALAGVERNAPPPGNFCRQVGISSPGVQPGCLGKPLTCRYKSHGTRIAGRCTALGHPSRPQCVTLRIELER